MALWNFFLTTKKFGNKMCQLNFLFAEIKGLFAHLFLLLLNLWKFGNKKKITAKKYRLQKFRDFFHVCLKKMKYGKDDGSNRRRAWVFGMKCRDTQKVFLHGCPRDSTGKYERTKTALLPIILANVHEGTASLRWLIRKLDGVGPVDNKPSTN